MLTKTLFMKKTILLFSAVVTLSTASQAQIFKDILKKDSNGQTGAQKILQKATSKSTLSNDDIISGLKEALNVGASNSTNKLSMVDGFFKDAAIKILMPAEAQKV